MQKRILLVMVLAMTSLLVACGSEQKDTSTTNEVEVSSEAESEEKVEAAEEAPIEETIDKEAYIKENFEYIGSYEGQEGQFYVDKYASINGEDWSYNEVYSELLNGIRIDFSYESPIALGKTPKMTFSEVHINSDDNYSFVSIDTDTFMYDSKFEDFLGYTKEDWISENNTTIELLDDGYFDMQTTDTTIRVILESKIENQKGYCLYLVDNERECYYQFFYMENEAIFDDTRAMKIIDSIDFIDYVEKDRTIITQEALEVVEPTEEPVEITEEEMFSDSYAWGFPEGMDGFTDKWVYANDETWSYNQTHYVDPRGREMNFIWEGPVELGEQAVQDVNTLALYGANATYELRAWHGGEITLEKFQTDLGFDKEKWTSFSSDNTPYVVDGYYDIQTTDTTIKVVFEVANDNYKGYNYYIVDLENAHCYQFAYLESVDIYDDARALKVVDSIKYWPDYAQ